MIWEYLLKKLLV